MKVAIVANSAWYLHNFRIPLVRALELAGHEVVCIARPDGYEKRLIEQGIRFRPWVVAASGINPFRELYSVLSLLSLFWRSKIDIAFTFTPKANIYTGIVAKFCVAEFVPNISGLGRVFIQRGWLTHVVIRLYKFSFFGVRRVFFQNLEDMQTFIGLEIADDGICVRLPGSGVDLDKFEFAPSKSGVEPPTFLMVARLLWDKGVGEYIEAARILKRKFPFFRFQILGFCDVDNPSAVTRAELMQWVTEGVVEYLGSADDVRPHLAFADCVVLPSYREGLPKSLLEAAAVGRAVIATDVPGCRDTVIDGVTGFICQVKDAESLAGAMEKFAGLSSHARVEMGRKARQFVSEKFDQTIVIRQYLDIISKRN